MEGSHSIFKSFRFAFEGVLVAFKKGKNFRIQVFLGTVAGVIAYFFNFTLVEWAILAITISLVLILELINTALESVVDIVSPEVRNEAKIAKDVAAASVLIASLAALLIAALLFLPKFSL